jgi:predicted Rossmann fold nucleotide-binding protein DprA/Smf involved in DNA uptake
VTQQSPSSGFTPAAAMARNKIVYGLSTVTLVVACAEGSGGT